MKNSSNVDAKKPTRFQDIGSLDNGCSECHNKGFTHSNGLLAKVLGVDVWFDIEYQRACTCKTGKDGLAIEQTINGCDCEYGRRIIYPDPNKFWIREMEFCSQCKPGQDLATRLDSMIATKKQKLYETLNTGLTADLREKNFDNFTSQGEMSETKGHIIHCLYNQKNILFMGDTGIGKTHLAAACLNAMLNQGKARIFVSLIDLMSSLRKSIKSNGPDWDELLERYTDVEFLVLDDLGQEKATEKVTEVVFHILNSRINRGLQTVVTTNYSLKRLVEVAGYTSAIKSRLAGFEQIAWEGQDHRLVQKPKLRVVEPWDEEF